MKRSSNRVAFFCTFNFRFNTMRNSFLIILLCFTPFMAKTQLNLKWQFQHPISKEWFLLGEKGSVQETFWNNGILPDPFYGENEEKYNWIEEHIWEFKSQFFLSEDFFNAKQLELVFPNVDTYGEIYVNDKLVGKTENYHVAYSFEIKNFVQCGYNEIRVRITPPVLYHAETYKNANFHYPAPNDVSKTKVAPLTRKPQYQFGWDWALRMNTVGFQAPAFVRIPPKNEVVKTVVNTISIANNIAHLELFLEVKNQEKLGKVRLKNSLQTWTTNELQLNQFRFRWNIENPKLWWPLGQGGQHLYSDTLQLLAADGTVLNEKAIRFGIRTSELKQQKDQWGTAYEIHVNGRYIFCKGGDYIPNSVFPTQVTDEQLKTLVNNMVASNFNMVRVWGGGYYPEETFFNLCDEAGIMVWQDLQFACAMYPGDDAFLNTVQQELNYQLPRITAHPAVVLINGNNEVDVAWKNWGFQITYLLGDKSQKIIERAYDDLFKKLAPTTISHFSNLPYIHTSPLSNWGKDEFYNHGSQHYWGVWHGKDPMNDFAKKTGRFNAEYGFQSFPEYSTLLTFSDTSQWRLNSSVMKHHQKSYVGNGMIEKHANLLYGKSKDFRQFVYFSQLTQAHAVSTAVTGHRLDAPRCAGTLYWQLNDCWPAPTWSSLDYFGNWKALQYVVRDDYRNVALLLKNEDNGNKIIYLKSDEYGTTNIKGTIEEFDLKGKLIKTSSFEKQLNYMGNEVVYSGGKLDEKFVRITLSDGYSRDFLISSKKQFNASPPKISLSKLDENSKTLWIEVENTQFCADFWLYSNQTGCTFDKNFISLLPGKHIFKVTYTLDKPELSDFGCQFR